MTLEVESSAWDGLLFSVGWTDVYYRRGYLEAAAAAEPGRCAYLYLRELGGAVVFPSVVRELPELGIRDVTTVAYGGPLGLGPRARFGQEHGYELLHLGSGVGAGGGSPVNELPSTGSTA
jgi:hypothetical protein